MDLVVTSVLTNEISIAWEYQMNGSSPRTGAEVEIRKGHVIKRTIIVGPEEEATNIASLNPLTLYIITVYVVTSVGRSRPSSTEISTLSLSNIL